MSTYQWHPPPDNPFGGSRKYKVGVIYGEEIEKLQKVEMFRSTQRSSNPVIFTDLLTTRGKIVGNVEHKKNTVSTDMIKLGAKEIQSEPKSQEYVEVANIFRGRDA